MAELRLWLGQLFVRDTAQTISVAMRRAKEFWMVAVHFNFLTQSSDREVDCSRDHVRVQIPPNRPEQFIAVHHSVATFREVAQELELAMRKRNSALPV